MENLIPDLDTKDFSLGIIGESEGNGHPWSWSAIINSFDSEKMQDCPYKAIPLYLSKQNFPEASIGGAKISHIWTQDKANSKKIAQTCFIDRVCDDPSEMIGSISGLLLARDDAEHHLNLASPFLEAGIPVYIDKPLAYSKSKALDLIGLQQWDGQIFSCSALKFAREMHASSQDLKEIGEIKHFEVEVPKSWHRYIIHGLEPALDAVANTASISSYSNISNSAFNGLNIDFTDKRTATLRAFKNSHSPILYRLFGDLGFREYQFYDAFSAFKKTLEVFLNQARTRKPLLKLDRSIEIASYIELIRYENQNIERNFDEQ